MPCATWKDLCLDALDPQRVGRFWAPLLGLTFEQLDDGDVRLTSPDHPARNCRVNRVPEAKTVKNREPEGNEFCPFSSG